MCRGRRARAGREEIRRAWLCAAALAAPCALAQPAPPDLARAETLIGAGRAEEAWQLLAPHEKQRAGRPEYDYILGIAALESGKPGRATFILERVLIADPGHVAARLEIARGYFALGDNERAAREFRAVIAAAPAEGTRAIAERYLARLEGRALAARRPLEAYVEATVGRDSNVNAAASTGGLLVPLAVASREADGFAALGAGATLSRELDRTYTVSAGADVRQRMHFELDQFDALSAALRLGLQARLSGRDQLRFALEHDEYDLDHASFRRTQGLSAQWIRAGGAGAHLSAFAQALRIRYRQAPGQGESSELVLAGLSAARAFGAMAVSANFYAGHDNATAGRVDGDRALAGIGATLQRRFGPGLAAHAGLSYLHADYRRDNPMIGARREDRTAALELGLEWQLARGWSLRPQLARTHNRSNVPLTEYGRTEASLSLRRVLR